ncbi:MAG: RNA polymerase subunit sigma-24, partial [Oscillospiraceae bacterium]|nr:RNA polymerase subunit sigma-24 [Oscillospiraceae bacterium]
MGNDADRYRRYLAGDDNGLIEIIDRYHEGLTLYLNSIVRNICVAEELMQETFIRLAVRKPRFSGRKYFKTWLYCIAKHCAIDY